eukprot:2539459-Pyramimonas_sp.AAC.1
MVRRRIGRFRTLEGRRRKTGTTGKTRNTVTDFAAFPIFHVKTQGRGPLRDPRAFRGGRRKTGKT